MDSSKTIMLLIFLIPTMLIAFINHIDAFVFKFTHGELPSVPSMEPRENPSEIKGYPFELDEQIQQLCHYAKMEDDLLYMDYDYLPTWIDHDESLWYITYCPTLPTVYLLKRDYKRLVHITYVFSPVKNYKFDTETIGKAETVSLAKEERKETCLTNLSLEDRRNLCVNAVRKFEKNEPIFLSTDVPEGQMYRFIISKQEEEHFSIPCPTSPKLYLYDENSEKTLKLMLVHSWIDDYEFQIEEVRPDSVSSLSQTNTENGLMNLDSEERSAFCARARKFTSLPVSDSNVPEAQMYSFQYSEKRKNFWNKDIENTENEDETRDIALLCPNVPKMYLRLEERLENIVTITLMKNPFKHQQFEIETHELSYIIRYTEGDDEEKMLRTVKEHPFSSLNEEDRWHLCSAAEEHIPSGAYGRLTIIPNQIEGPQMRGLIRFKASDREVLAIKCSAEPSMYLFGDTELVTISIQEEQTAPSDIYSYD